MQTVGLVVFIVIVSAIAVWLLGSIALRVAGIAFVLAGLVGIVPHQGSNVELGLLSITCGAAAWFLGHLLFAWQHEGAFCSPIAARLARRGSRAFARVDKAGSARAHRR